MNDPGLSFNLWREPWMRVTRADGTPDVLGIGACLALAHKLASLSAAPSPCPWG